MKKIPPLKKKTTHKLDPDSLAMALNRDKIAKEMPTDADLDRGIRFQVSLEAQNSKTWWFR